MSRELGELVVALHEMHLLRELTFPFCGVEQDLVGAVPAGQTLDLLVNDLVQDHVSGSVVLQGTKPLDPLEIPPMAVKIAGHDDLSVVGKRKQRAFEQRILAVELRRFENRVGRAAGVVHSFSFAVRSGAFSAASAAARRSSRSSSR